eukprot:Hpha_TRINITY_DN15420_c2_g3::TRINITY_DN15420_c2_g3_i1::g.176916::m.176916
MGLRVRWFHEHLLDDGRCVELMTPAFIVEKQSLFFFKVPPPPTQLAPVVVREGEVSNPNTLQRMKTVTSTPIRVYVRFDFTVLLPLSTSLLRLLFSLNLLSPDASPSVPPTPP